MFPLHSHYILMVSTIRSYIATNKNRSCQTDDPQFLSILNDSWTKPQIKRNHVAFVASSSIFPVPKSPHFPMISPIIPISPIFPSFLPSFFHHFSHISIIFLYCFLIFAPFCHGQNVWPILGLAEESLSVRLTSLQKLQRLLVQQVVP